MVSVMSDQGEAESLMGDDEPRVELDPYRGGLGDTEPGE
jgi:hypothetical protein